MNAVDGAGGHAPPVAVTVHESAGGVYVVESDEGTRREASLRGRLKREGRHDGPPVVGDRVQVRETDGGWVIDGIEPRRNVLVRRAPGGRKPRVLAANLDLAIAVVAAAAPPATTALVDRLLALAHAAGIPPLLVVNKMDLVDADGELGSADVAEPDPRELVRLYRGLDYGVVCASARTGEGIDELRRATKDVTSVLAGPSGVGKSSLLNALEPGLSLRIGSLSRKSGRGRHTTVSGRLIRLAHGGLVADTPGFAEAGLWQVPAADVQRCFPEIDVLAESCRFRSCTHLHEPDCAVRAAVERGEIVPSRYGSYRAIFAEASGG